MALQPLSILLSEQNAQGHCFFLVLLARTHRPLPIHLPEERQTVVPSAQQDLDLRMPTPMTISWWPDVFSAARARWLANASMTGASPFLIYQDLLCHAGHNPCRYKSWCRFCLTFPADSGSVCCRFPRCSDLVALKEDA